MKKPSWQRLDKNPFFLAEAENDVCDIINRMNESKLIRY